MGIAKKFEVVMFCLESRPLNVSWIYLYLMKTCLISSLEWTMAISTLSNILPIQGIRTLFFFPCSIQTSVVYYSADLPIVLRKS